VSLLLAVKTVEATSTGSMTNPNRNRFQYFFLNALLVISFVSAAIPFHGQTGGEPIVIGKKFQVHSDILNETRALLIATPQGYDQEAERYAVLYVLDGNENFVQAAGIVQSLTESDRIPPMLVVGIGSTERSRDLTPPTEVEIEKRFHPKNGGAGAFLQFISTELIPYVDQHYRTRPYKILVGHSIGGLFAIYTLASNPKLFNAYIAIDPTLSWNNQATVTRLETVFKDIQELPSDLYVTATDEGGPALSADYKLCGILNQRTPRDFRWNFKQMPGETHTSIPHQSIYSGLDHIFDGWHLANPLKLYDEGGLEAVHRHFAEGGRWYGYNRSTPAFTVSLIVAALMAKDRLEEAASVLQHDPKTYPAPWNQLDALARAYEQRGDKEHAIHYYELSLKVNPNNEWARKKLKEAGVDVDSRFPQQPR
jgi:predicted alpha/beta superfamily hydrolase